MTPLNILHLSDFHIGNSRYSDPRTLSVKIANTIHDNLRKVDVIVVSGDIFDGRRSEEHFEEDRRTAIILFDTLIEELISNDSASRDFNREDILFIPGNHDLIREYGKEYEKYDLFINEFYPSGRISDRIIFSDKYSFYYVSPIHKVIILGFNSCKIEIETIKKEELRWIDSIDLTGISNSEEIRERIRENRIKEKKWDDFGYIDTIEMSNLFKKVKKDVSNLSEYNIVATFHHHFYPFPEIINRKGDPSWVRNYQEVVSNFQRHNVNIVLHGHKHLSIHRVVTDAKYFENPESVIYVLAAGSAGCKDVYNPSFQWLRVYDKHSTTIADVERFDFKDEEPMSPNFFTLPPHKKDDKVNSTRLLDALQSGDYELYEKYKDITDDFEQIFQDNSIDKIIEAISGLITIFEDINKELRRDSNLVFILLIAINYRVIYLKLKRSDNPKSKIDEILKRLENELKNGVKEEVYFHNLINFLKSSNNRELDEINYQKIIKNVKNSEKRYSAYISISVFFTDLFLDISQYGEYYFNKEGIKHKINIKLNEDLFYDSIPNQTIFIEGDIERRAIIINFRCKNPTVHKIAVLIVKDFEMRLTRFEDSLREIDLKLYYIIPKVQRHSYDLENFHFDAYIPTLLPLLTGDNLYKQKEVFIRELVQNSIDAVLLRQKLQPSESFDSTIRLELGTEKRDAKEIKYLKIIDQGIGMTNFTIERYFTSIGRSFYVSEEFDELQKQKNIKYEAISNFGIGFLSSFMVCKEINVRTRSILDDEHGLEIEIPNYDGCFFVKNQNKKDIGTEITLYEDNRKLFKINKFIEYIKKVFLNIPLKLEISKKDSSPENFYFEEYALQKELILEKLRNRKQQIFFVPFTDNSIGKLSWEDLILKDIQELPKYGIYFDFSDFDSIFYLNKKGNIISKILNQGLLISDNFSLLNVQKDYIYHIQTINFPSSFIQLDVSREKIIQLKKDITLESKSIIDSFKDQLSGFLSDGFFLNSLYPFDVNKIVNYLKLGLKRENSELIKFCFSMKIEIEPEDSFLLSVIQNSQIPKKYNPKREVYFNFYNIEDFSKVFDLEFFKTRKSKLKNSKGKKDDLVIIDLIKTVGEHIFANKLDLYYEEMKFRSKIIEIEQKEFQYKILELKKESFNNELIFRKTERKKQNKLEFYDFPKKPDKKELVDIMEKLENSEVLIRHELIKIVERRERFGGKNIKEDIFSNSIERTINEFDSVIYENFSFQNNDGFVKVAVFYIYYLYLTSYLKIGDIENEKIKIYL